MPVIFMARHPAASPQLAFYLLVLAPGHIAGWVPIGYRCGMALAEEIGLGVLVNVGAIGMVLWFKLVRGVGDALSAVHHADEANEVRFVPRLACYLISG